MFELDVLGIFHAEEVLVFNYRYQVKGVPDCPKLETRFDDLA